MNLFEFRFREPPWAQRRYCMLVLFATTAPSSLPLSPLSSPPPPPPSGSASTLDAPSSPLPSRSVWCRSNPCHCCALCSCVVVVSLLCTLPLPVISCPPFIQSLPVACPPFLSLGPSPSLLLWPSRLCCPASSWLGGGFSSSMARKSGLTCSS